MEGQINSNSNQHRIEKIEDMLSKSPQDCFLLHALALENQKIGQEREAISLFEKVLTINDNYVGSYYHLAKLYEKLDKEKAIAIYKKGIAIAQKNKENLLLNELRNALEDLEDE